LRTLCLAYKTIPEPIYRTWAAQYAEAAASLVDRDAHIDSLSESIEQNLILLGATAIEDKLQEGVPEALEKLTEAGIKVWVLTGDKIETAINVGFSCGLLENDMDLVMIRSEYRQAEAGGGGVAAAGRKPSHSHGSSSRINNTNALVDAERDNILRQIHDAIEQFCVAEPDSTPRRTQGSRSVKERGDQDSTKSETSRPTTIHQPRKALVMDGGALHFALETPTSKSDLLRLSTSCDAVLCCRVSPLQKAEMVRLVQASKKDLMCLAIGDGANDVGMIQAANIGVGILGKEGPAAAMAADYTMSQFRFLCRLLFVHGTWSYLRTAKMIINFFFKNIIWTMVPFWYQIMAGFSTAYAFDFSYLLLYNVIFTSIPVMVLGIFDKDLSENYTLYAAPLYIDGIQQKAFTFLDYIIVVLESIYQSLVCFYIPVYAYGESATDSTGHAPLNDEFGILFATCTILNANLFIAINIS
ncbi:hypothetical protein HK102_008812, partial [Quaeritorhiza haematococci]